MIFFSICFILFFGATTWIDFKSFIIPNWISFPLMIFGLLFNSFHVNRYCSIEESATGLIIGYCLIRFVDFIYFKLRRQHGIGQGDAKLLGAIGSILGYEMVFPVLLMASLLGLIYGLFIHRKMPDKMQQAIPFGPFLSLITCAIIASKIYF